jgi:hypothetical protein
MKQSQLGFCHAQSPLIVCCGVGVDSVAMLVGMKAKGIVPDIICFADVGSERQSTYDYIPILNDWLKRVGFPPLTIVTYRAKNFKHFPPYFSLEENILTNITLPSIAYGGHSCSAKWKIQPINDYCDTWQPAKLCWSHGGKCLKAIGFEDSKHERKRAERGCNTFATQADEKEKYELWFPLQQWGWNRERCELEITMAGLPVPDKSSCYFCTAMKPWEVDTLPADKLKRIVIIEARTVQRHLEFAEAKAAEKGVDWDGKPLTEGLWRKRVKGKFANGKPNGAYAKPGSITEYIREKGLLPSSEIDRIQAATPTTQLSADDFSKLGFSNWQDWIKSITE